MARLRSPNFPGIPLEAAVTAVSDIFDKNRQAVIMREDAAKDIGYSGLTGRSMKILGALNQYDLVENVSKGQMRVTDTARDILHGFPEAVKLDALHRAGNAPPLFNSIYDRFDGEIPGENAVRSFLIQTGFTNQGVDKALKSFLETNRYLEIKGASESYGKTEESAPESSPDNQRQEEKVSATVQAMPSSGQPIDFSFSMNRVAVMGATRSRTELQKFIDKLSAAMILLPEDATSEDDRAED